MSRFLKTEDSRELLKTIGIEGEVIQVNGHGEQSVALLLDSGDAFIGDLAPEHMIGEDDKLSKADWQVLRSKGAKFIKPAHAGEYAIE